jgi:gliding motility-associated-like protein
VEVRVFDRPEVYVPNAFTPNSDGKNDVLRPTAVQVVEITYFRVFNRWGELIYQTNSFDGGWDGTYKGQLQPCDTYVWIFEGKDTNGKVISAKGTTTLFR